MMDVISFACGNLDWSFDRLRTRFDGLGDDEYFWEPAPGCWSVRRAEDTTVPGPRWHGWVQEIVFPPPDPPPVTTIAWRFTHLVCLNAMYRDYAFGRSTLEFSDCPVPASAAEAIDLWADGYRAFVDALRGSAPADLDRHYEPHWGQPRTVDTQVSIFITENLHHGAEIALLRDLYRAAG
jgi:hypothetical protein